MFLNFLERFNSSTWKVLPAEPLKKRFPRNQNNGGAICQTNHPICVLCKVMENECEGSWYLDCVIPFMVVPEFYINFNFSVTTAQKRLSNFPNFILQLGICFKIKNSSALLPKRKNLTIAINRVNTDIGTELNLRSTSSSLSGALVT